MEHRPADQRRILDLDANERPRKKLRAVARAVTQDALGFSSAELAEVRRDLATFGATPEMLERLRAAEDARRDVEIIAERWNMPAIRVWVDCEPERIVIPGGLNDPPRVMQLNVSAAEVQAVAAAHGVPFDDVLLWSVRVMASTAASEHNARAGFASAVATSADDDDGN